MSIEDLIADLLMQHNCVIVPSFGGFVAGKTSATFDASKGIMVPPRKSLLFNKQLLNNDGLLAAAFAHATQVDYNEAFQKIQATVQLWRSNLENGERITIDRVGFLFLDAERNIGFEQDRFSNLLMSSFGLVKVHFIPKEDIAIIPNQIEEAPILVFDVTNDIGIGAPVIEEEVESHEDEELAPIIPLDSNSRKTTIWKYVAAAALVPICFYSYWLPMKTNVLESGMIATQDFNPFYHASPSNYVKNPFSIDFKYKEEEDSFLTTINHLPSDVNVVSFELDPETFVMVKVRESVTTSIPKPIVTDVPKPKVELIQPVKKVTPPIVKSEKVAVKSNTSTKNTGNLHLVVGCFSTEQNANELISKLKTNGINAYIVDQSNGLHRVSAVSGSSDSAFLATKEKLAGLKMTGWLLRK